MISRRCTKNRAMSVHADLCSVRSGHLHHGRYNKTRSYNRLPPLWVQGKHVVWQPAWKAEGPAKIYMFPLAEGKEKVTHNQVVSNNISSEQVFLFYSPDSFSPHCYRSVEWGWTLRSCCFWWKTALKEQRHLLPAACTFWLIKVKWWWRKNSSALFSDIK